MANILKVTDDLDISSAAFNIVNKVKKLTEDKSIIIMINIINILFLINAALHFIA
jgi:hypothetical protein